MTTNKVLLIGYGSIGKRHSRNLVELGIEPFILTRYPDDLDAIFIRDVNEIKNENIEYCIISSPTGRHLDDLKKCLSLKKIPKKVLIEKPLECSYTNGIKVKNLAEKKGLNLSVAHNLRFLDAFSRIRNFVSEQKESIKIVEAVAGQDLKEWRPDKDYTQSYSVSREQGGGVDLDLSHEIDYIIWMFGNKFREKILYRSKISSLKIDSPDIFRLTLDYTTFIANISLDYIRKPPERYLKIICENGKNLFYDFISNTLKIDGEKIVMKDNIDQSYKKMLKSFLGFDKKNESKLCTIEEGLNILKILEV